MAQRIRMLTEHKDLSLNPEHPPRKATCACNSCATEDGAGGSLELTGYQLSEFAFYCCDKTQ